jgi:Epoxide hydrolase N terminus
MTVRPFRIEVPQDTLDAIRAKVRGYEWHEAPRGVGLESSWAYGANLDFMKRLCAYWAEEYDWGKWEAELNRFPQSIADVDGLDIHFYLEEGSGPSPCPLILSHGWPGSVFEFLHIIEKLAHPERFGGDVADAFTVIVPSLPGYGWSGKPARPIGPRTVARYFDRLMTDVLGLPGYIAQGGDWGSAISGWMATKAKAAGQPISTCSAGARPACIPNPRKRRNMPRAPHSCSSWKAPTSANTPPSRKRSPTR